MANFLALKTTNLSAILAVLYKLSKAGIDASIGCDSFGNRWVVQANWNGNTIVVKDDNVLGALNKALDRIEHARSQSQNSP